VTRRRVSLLASATVAALSLTACGTDRTADTGVVADGSTVIDVTMTDMAFTPTVVEVKPGESVRFRFRNDGQVVHEAVIGDDAFQQEHAEEMIAMGSSADSMRHSSGDQPEALVLRPGETGEMTYEANAAGRLLIGCHQPGHWEAGMKATIDVA
jgi:uncharacterized cupredoxin-like copper-binding protein